MKQIVTFTILIWILTLSACSNTSKNNVANNSTTEGEIEYGIFESGTYISTHGYYYAYTETGAIDYNYYTMPIIFDGKIVGEFDISRDEKGKVSAGNITVAYADPSKFTKIIKANQPVAVVLSSFSKYVISPSNDVFIIYGDNSPELTNQDTLYEAWNMKDNVITGEIFNSEDAYYTVP